MHTAEIWVIGGETPLHTLLMSEGYTVWIDAPCPAAPRLIIIDPEGVVDKTDGLLKRLRDDHRAPIIVLSHRNEEEDIIATLDDGADDYLVKPFRPGELLARIRAALRSAVLSEPGEAPVIRSGSLEIDLSTRTVKKNNEWVKLTATQYSLLALFGRNAGKVLTHHYLLHEVWGSDYTGELQYLRVFIGQLRKKIERDIHSPEHIITESGVGYRFARGE
ncbi:MAG TPA: response regulator transcription factor [Puia sp.]|jgi:two-component system KDP operon response regulator KdpE